MFWPIAVTQEVFLRSPLGLLQLSELRHFECNSSATVTDTSPTLPLLRDSVVKIATEWKSNPGGGDIFPNRGHPVSCTMGTGSLLGGKAAGAWRGVNHPLPSSAEIIERVELYFYFRSVP